MLIPSIYTLQRKVACSQQSSHLYDPHSHLSMIPELKTRPLKPTDYPLSPFKMKFDPPLFHPNSKGISLVYKSTNVLIFASIVYADGNVCISILHTPGDDPTMYEQASERWSPVQSVEKVILSVISMLAGEHSYFQVPHRIPDHVALNI